MRYQLTPTQEDYLEAVYRIAAEQGNRNVRVTDIARSLKCRLPTVTRMVSKLTERNVLKHKHRGLVSLSRAGRLAAENIVHRHEDLVMFLERILGLPKRVAERDTCQIEHGISRQTPERLHPFLEYLKRRKQSRKRKARSFPFPAPRHLPTFHHLPRGRPVSWRG